MKSVYFFAAALFANVVACSASPTESSNSTTGAITVSAQGQEIVGSYQATNLSTTSPFASLTLKSDGDYTANHLCGGNGSCFALIPADHGTWKVSKSGPQLGAPQGGIPMLELTSKGGDGKQQFFYGVDGSGDLSLYPFFNAPNPFVFAPANSTAECNVPTDCTGLLPRSTEVCADGTNASAQWDCNASQCVIAYCDDNGGPATDDAGSTANSCNAASDCTGLLPRTAEQCADGTTGSAQWDCVSNQCTVSVCGDNGGVASFSCASVGGTCESVALITQDGCTQGTLTSNACSNAGDQCCIPNAASN